MPVNAFSDIEDWIFIGQGMGYLGNAAMNVVYPAVKIICKKTSPRNKHVLVFYLDLLF
ncbi:MAG: hypothetical protein WCR02_10035 [Sphaerochaetaceae bacterium]